MRPSFCFGLHLRLPLCPGLLASILVGALATLALAASAAPAQAEPQASLAPADGPLKPLLTGTDSKGWQGVGRLDLGHGSFCTGTLIAPDLVLTAAHCLFDKTGARLIDPGQITFLAGWRGGRAAAYRGAKRLMVDTNYRHSTAASGPERVARVRADLGLIELDQPIRLAQIAPFGLDDPPRPGEPVQVVSYAHDRADAPSLQSECTVLMRDAGVILMNCAADFGTSGAPVFALRDGVARVVSVVSAKAVKDGAPVSLGAFVGDVENLEAAMAAKRLTPDPQEKRAPGARFIRP